LVEKQGVHAFVLTMSTDAFRAEPARDFWPRIALAGIALVAVVGLGVAWHNLERSSALQMRLLRASELNLHLQEMNVAAAGLAHETRNPLNTIRGLAQMVSKHADVSPEIRGKSREITEEVDRVTGRLNQFIDYSRPPEVRPAPTNIKAVVGDVASALETDIEDKQIQFEMTGPELTVEADESLLRQVIFNLLLNSIQAVDREGMIEVLLEKTGPDEASIEVRDNGPGVPDHAREEVFRPYFTTSEEGTGLGLAVVRQLVLAHQWELAYIPGDAGGARFRVTGLKLT
jgi:signal transduction histidine kinase